MSAQRFRNSGKIRVVAEEDFLSDGEVELCGGAACTTNDHQGIERFAPGFVRPDEVIAPWLQAEIDGRLQV
jgi:hypothetical protein